VYEDLWRNLLSTLGNKYGELGLTMQASIYDEILSNVLKILDQLNLKYQSSSDTDSIVTCPSELKVGNINP